MASTEESRFFAVVVDPLQTELLAYERNRRPEHGFGPDRGVTFKREAAVLLGGLQRTFQAAVTGFVGRLLAGFQAAGHALAQPGDTPDPVGLDFLSVAVKTRR